MTSVIAMARRHGPVLAAFLLVTIAYTWPLAWHLTDAVPRDLGDPLLSIWTLWWNAHTLPFTSAWWNGPVFVPAAGSLAFSDHRVGLGLAASPLIWVGASPLMAYNVTLLLTFVLSALAAYALALALTERRLPAFAAGLAFGFHPFRAAHLEHLELLAAFWLPVVFLCLHRWREERAVWALPGLAMSLTMLALTSGYYFVFGGVLVAGWVLWFARGMPVADILKLGAALVVPFLAIAPILLTYRAVHEALGFARSITDIESFSADVVDFLVAPEALAFWPSVLPGTHPERALFPGLTALGLTAWAVVRHRSRTPVPAGPSRLRRVTAAVGVAAFAVALASLCGLDAASFGPLHVSFRQPYKPLSIATAAFALWALTSTWGRRAWTERSILDFYALGVVAMWLCALGPTARAAGERVLYKAPYSWLMLLPGVGGGFRVPARFAMIAAFALSITAALALARWPPATSWRRRAAWSVVLVGILADGWIAPLALYAPPRNLDVPERVAPGEPIIELPIGTYEDAAAMYRAIGHRHPLVNGLSGYEPAHYTVVREALRDGDVTALMPLAARQPLVAFVAATGAGPTIAESLTSVPGAVRIATTPTHHVFRLSLPVSGAVQEPLHVLPIRDASGIPPEDVALALDDNPATVWRTPSQQGAEQLRLDLGAPAVVAGVTLTLGTQVAAYPRHLLAEVSDDGVDWRRAWQGQPAALVVAAALLTPRHVAFSVSFAPQSARFVRLTQLGRADTPWEVASISLLGRR